MGSAEKYRQFADECMTMAERMPVDARPILMQMAETWLELAEAELQSSERTALNRRH
jgi:hypothetical protein